MINRKLIEILQRYNLDLEVFIGSKDELDPTKTTPVYDAEVMVTVDEKSKYIQIN